MSTLLRGLLKALGVYKLYEWWLESQVKSMEPPKHIALILDGNRRWASRHNLAFWEGHRAGMKKAEEVLRWSLDLGIKIMTFYVFSTENFQRSKEEVEKLMELCEEKFKEILENEDIHRYRVRIKVLGDLGLLPEELRKLILKVEASTAGYDSYWLNIALAYGGRREIVSAARIIGEEILKGKLAPEEIDEGLFMKYLYTSHLPNPEPDLIIRTSGEERLSGFLLWQSAYSELCFLDVYWPEFRRIDLLRAIRTFQKRKRRFGR
ncbi:MAG: polyprenyl diphosphate synthase [Candidatus Bathyarchaeia archaeon]